METRVRGAAFVLLLLGAIARAHEHHEDKIEDGHVISDDPIVRGQRGKQERYM